MTDGFYSAKSGVLAMQAGMDITANNLANVSTDGFKAERGSFSDLIYTVRNKKNKDVDMGHGTKLTTTDKLFKVSSLRHTEGQLDFALPNEGFFAMQREDGTVTYTRNGAFTPGISPDGTYYLCNTSGYRVLDGEGNPIPVPYNEDGTINTEGIIDKMCAYSFPNPYGLNFTGDNFMDQTASSGEATANKDLDVLNGYLENSGTDVATEMVNVIKYQKAFSMNSKMVQTADELEKIVNNLR